MYTYIQLYLYAHARTLTHTRAHSHACTHARARTHTNTHMHIRTFTDREEWRLFLRGQSEDSPATGLGRDGVLRDATRCAIPEHYNVSRSLMHEMKAADDEEQRMQMRSDQVHFLKITLYSDFMK